MISYQFNLEVTPGSMPPILHMAQYDTGRTFVANLKNNGTAFTPTQGSEAKIKGRNAAGVCWEQEATVSGSTVEFTPEGAATDQFGIMPVQLEIYHGDDILSTLLMVFDIQRAGYTNEEAVRSPEFETALEAAVAAAIEEGGIGFSDEFKQALLACFTHVAWADEHGQDYYDALEASLYPDVTLLSITADYQQDHPIYDTDPLDAIKVSDDLTVTANYSDGTSVVLGDDDYELSGTLTVGTSTITATYEGKTATFNVTVTENTVDTGYTSIGTPNITDNILTAGSSGAIRTNNVFSPGSSPWKIRTKFTYSGSGNTYKDVFGSCNSSGTNSRGILLEKSTAVGLFLSSSTDSWDILNAGQTFNVASGSTYVYEVEFTGTQYKSRYSTNGGSTWTELTPTSSTALVLGGYYVGFGISRNGYFTGTIDLTETKIWVGGNLWWKAVA